MERYISSHLSVYDPALTTPLVDYRESSYIGLIECDQPHSEACVNSCPHLGFLDMMSYAQAYKTGTYPPIARDKVYIWSRPHPCDSTASQDFVGRQNNSQRVRGFVFPSFIQY
jgi:glucan endo-1,3-alpha-glucosidase